MTGSCTDPGTGALIHAYELNQLNESDCERFELHLLSCQYCFAEVQAFDLAAKVLLSDSDIQLLTRESVNEEPIQGIFARIKRLFWPAGTPFLLRPALGYLVLLFLIYPAYLGLISDGESETSPAQILIMTGTRSTERQAVSPDMPIVLLFRAGQVQPGDTLTVMLQNAVDRIVYENSSFTAISNERMGSLVFAAGSLAPGEYTLIVSSPLLPASLRYTFRVN